MDWTRLGPGIRPKVRDAFVEVRNYLYPPMGEVFYVSKRGASGDGKSWAQSFLTITEGIAALTDDDTLIIGAGNFDEEAPKITITDKKNIRIFGMGTGMQWGEGSTNWRSVTSGADLFDIAGCQGLEIAGIGFIVPTDNMDGITLAVGTSICYSIHIHDCCFIGDCGSGAKMAYGINAGGGDCADLYVHHCRFFRCKTGIYNVGPRAVIEKNVFAVPASGKGIAGVGPATAAYTIIKDNDFLGVNSSDYGIYDAGGSRGNFMITNNRFANFASATGYGILLGTGDYNCVENYRADAAGAVTVVDPEQ